MVANAGQTPVLARPSPAIPPDVKGSLANYLRTFALWCERGLAGKLNANTALPAILLLSPGGKVFSVGVADDGTLTVTAVPLGGGTSPAVRFAERVP